MLHPSLPLLAVAMALVSAVPAAAQDYDNDDSGGYRQDYRDRRDSRYDQNYDRDDDRVPYAGADLGYDYLTGEYYRYEGPRQQDPRVREQTGWRDGRLHTKPNYGYYAGVKWIGGYWRSHCGCSAWYGRHRGYYYDEAYEPYERHNGYFERYASSNSHRWGYEDRHGFGYYGWGY